MKITRKTIRKIDDKLDRYIDAIIWTRKNPYPPSRGILVVELGDKDVQVFRFLNQAH